MAVPFNIPDEDEPSAAASESSSSSNTMPNTPSRPISVPQQNQNDSHQQITPIHNEMLVQAFYEALCRCSQGRLNCEINF
jgi:hypothetical protein